MSSEKMKWVVAWAGILLGTLGLGLGLAATVFDGSGASHPGAIVTHVDRIPDFGASASVTSVTSGAWSNPVTWSPRRVPTTGDTVRIAAGTTVLYDARSSAVLSTVRVEGGGTLRFHEAMTTQLVVANLFVLPGGVLLVGSSTLPIAPQVSATIMIADQPTDASTDPEQFGTSLIGLGRITMHGAAKAPTFVRLSREARAGDVFLDLAAPVSGWAVGDRLFVPDSRQLRWNERGANYVPQWETVTVASISSNRISVTPSLRFDHPGSRVLPSDSPEFLPHVANLSRNVVVRSANARGTRGFVMFTERAEVDIRYVSFGGLGRTTSEPFNDTTFDSSGYVTSLGSNQSGRYPIYFRHLVGPSVRPANGYQFTFIGNSITCPLDPMPFRWGLVLDDSHYGLLQDNIVNNWASAGFVTVNGSESHNVIERNFVSRIRGTGERVDQRAVAGTGYWFRGPNNIVRNNVATGSQGGAYTYGFSVFSYYLGSRLLPTAPGADPADSDGGRLTDMHALPLRQFSGNEVYGATGNGLTLWWIGTYFKTPRPSVARSVVNAFRVWNIHGWGYFGYETNKVTLDSFVARGSEAEGTGLYYGDYFTQDHEARRVDIRGMKLGINLPVFVGGTGRVVVRDSYFDNLINVSAETPYTVSYRGDGIPPRTADLTNLSFGSRVPTFRRASPLDVEMRYVGPNVSFTRNWVQSDRVLVSGTSGAFALYYPEQAPTFVVPMTTFNRDGTMHDIGSPEAGLTNAQNWQRHGLAVGAAVAPCAIQQPRIKGFVCPQ